MDVEVIGIRKFNKGDLRAFVDVRFDDIIIHDFRILQRPGRNPWVSLPVRMWTSEGGERFYSPLIDLSDQLRRLVVKQVLDAWNGF